MTIIEEIRSKLDSGASLYEVVVLLMQQADKLKDLSGPQKENYVIEIILKELKIEADPEAIRNIIHITINLSQGLYDINKKNGIFSSCFGLKI